MATILVTGGAGFIGSHTCLVLLNAGFEVVVIDNFCNSDRESIKRVQVLTGKSIPLYQVDLSHAEAIRDVFIKHTIDAVIHFAGLKSVAESCHDPILYYANNLQSTLVLLQEMLRAKVFNLIFSSSATIYDSLHPAPYQEKHPVIGKTPYGQTKLMIEQILSDLPQSDLNWNISILRYFNPAGAHPSGMIGESPKTTPSNLLPFICHVAAGKQESLRVFGNDYPTPDGTGIRDYIHVMDLAQGHLFALNEVLQQQGDFFEVYNLGSGKGYSVLEIINAFEETNRTSIPYTLAGRRTGDVAISYADTSKIERRLGWQTHYTLHDICQDAWSWQKQNPSGF